MVFTIGVDAIYQNRKQQQARNKLFTAFTRAKGWLRVSGMGSGAAKFKEEIDKALQLMPRMQFIQPDVSTTCIGMAASIAAVLLCAGEPAKRFALPNSRVLIHQPWIGGVSGQATDIDIHAREILRLRASINEILAQHTKQSVQKVEHDVERDFWMSAQQALDYGMVDEIIYKHK